MANAIVHDNRKVQTTDCFETMGINCYCTLHREPEDHSGTYPCRGRLKYDSQIVLPVRCGTSFHNNTILVFTTIQYQFSQQYKTNFHNTRPVFTTIQDQFSQQQDQVSQQYKTSLYSNTGPVFTTIQDQFLQYKTGFCNNTTPVFTTMQNQFSQYKTGFCNNRRLVFTTIQDQFSQQYKTSFHNTRPVFTTIQDPFSQQYKTSFHSNTRHLVTEIKIMCILIVNFLDGARELKYFVMD